MNATSGPFAVAGTVVGIMGGEARVTTPNGTTVKAVVGLDLAGEVGGRYGLPVVLVGRAEWASNGIRTRFVVERVLGYDEPVDFIVGAASDTTGVA